MGKTITFKNTQRTECKDWNQMNKIKEIKVGDWDFLEQSWQFKL